MRPDPDPPPRRGPPVPPEPPESDRHAALREAIQHSRQLVQHARELSDAAARVILVSRWVVDDLLASRLARGDGARGRHLRMCSYCSRVGNTVRRWAHVPERLRPHGALLTHTICRDCWAKIPEVDGEPYPEE